MSIANEAGVAEGFAVPQTAPAQQERLPHAELTQLRRAEGARRATTDATLRRALGLTDVVVIEAVLLTVCALWDRTLEPFGAVAAGLAIVVAMKLMGLYDRDAQVLHKSTLEECPRLAAVAAGAGLFALLSGDLLTDPILSRAAGGAVALGLALLLPPARAATRALVGSQAPVERCLLVGNGVQAASLRAAISATPGVKASLVRVLPPPGGELAAQAEAAVIVDAALESDAHRIIIPADRDEVEDLLAAIRRFNQDGLKVSLAPSTGHLMQAAVEIDRLGGVALLGVHGVEMTRSSRILKRGFDIAISLPALVILSPLFLAIAIAIKLDSPGPVLFRQLRGGREGVPFGILKFRSMKVGAEDELAELEAKTGELFKMADDPRVTRVGRLIRKWSVDELPQLINVLGGEMSLVGPRPLPLSEEGLMGSWSEDRLTDVNPGVTGPWQVLAGVDRVPIEDMIRLEVQYVSGWSLWGDFKILMLTVAHVAARRGH